MPYIDKQIGSLFHEVSAGGVVLLQRRGKPHVLVIERARINDCCLPKGHQENSESLQQTAVREVKEETGFLAKPTSYLGNYTYSVRSGIDNRTILRTVHWFLMNTSGGQKRKPNNEIKRVRIESLDGDFSFLSYKNENKLIAKVKSQCLHL